MNEQQKVTFTQGKVPREQLPLVSLRFVAADDWIDKLGHRAFCTWLKFITFVDRTDKNREEDRIPQSLQDLAKRLGVSFPTLNNVILKPLWEYGFIDIFEYEDSKRNSQKPKNIVVYKTPFNRHDTEVKPLEKLRDWKDRDSPSVIHGRKGGKPAHQKNANAEIDDPFQSKPGGSDHPKKNFRVENLRLNGKKFFRVHGKKIFRVTLKKILANNKYNTLFNHFNTLTNTNKSSMYVGSALDHFCFIFPARVNEATKKELRQQIDKHGDVLVKAAIDRAAKNAVNPPQYITGILAKWEKAGVKTLEDISQYETQYKTKLAKTKADKQKKDYKPNYSKAVMKQMQEQQEKQETSTLSEEELAERKARFEAKLKALDEVAKKRNQQEYDYDEDKYLAWKEECEATLK